MVVNRLKVRIVPEKNFHKGIPTKTDIKHIPLIIMDFKLNNDKEFSHL